MFANRQAAGELLVRKLGNYKDSTDTVVVALPRGGVVVGAEISEKLNLPLEVLVVKKLSAPFNPELAIGSVGQNSTRYIDWEMVRQMNIQSDYLEDEIKSKFKELEERIHKYNINTANLTQYTHFILADDGVATGATVKAAINVLENLALAKEQKPDLILAIPVIAQEVYNELKEEYKIVTLKISGDFGSVGQYYSEFGQVEDSEVIKIINKFRRN